MIGWPDLRPVVGKNLKRYREERGLTQRQLEAASGVYREAISGFETGKALPNLLSLVKLCKALEVPLDAIVR